MACDRKTNREYYKSRHRCVKCGRQDAYTLNGRSFCAECAEKRAAWIKRYRAAYPDKWKGYKATRAEKERRLGLCHRCGKPVHDGYSRCPVCRALERERRREKQSRDSTTNFPRGANGICFICNKNRSEDGKKLCLVCLEKGRARLEAARATARGKVANHPWQKAN